MSDLTDREVALLQARLETLERRLDSIEAKQDEQGGILAKINERMAVVLVQLATAISSSAEVKTLLRGVAVTVIAAAILVVWLGSRP